MNAFSATVLTVRAVRSCQVPINDTARCKFFLWDTDAHKREAAALSENSRTENYVNPITPSKRQPSPLPPPYTSSPSRKRSHASFDADEEYGFDQTHADELENVAMKVETPCKALKTADFSTPIMRRRLPWQSEKTETLGTYGLQTPQTGPRTPNNPFAPGLATPQFENLGTPPSHQSVTPSSSAETPTPQQFKNIDQDDLVRDVFGFLQIQRVQLPPSTEMDLKTLLAQHSRAAEGYKRGREVSRKIIAAKEAKVRELTYRISTLEAELEAEKATVEFLQQEESAQSFD